MNRKLIEVLPAGAGDRIAEALKDTKGTDVSIEFALALASELMTHIEHLDGRLRELESKAASDAQG